ncbi:MAG: cob(I)yrinic acid a,c-diamide adenosyltransferase [Fibrobacteria bacterium]|nr:cob(I)yrinic acid a,c-diamide adenosyltransferase [Fibrobacteria bacterium]
MAEKLTKIYTRGGDTGQTALVGGVRVSKGHLRVEAYGTIDELNSNVGMARAYVCHRTSHLGIETGRLADILIEIQNDLMHIGSRLATPPEKLSPKKDISGLLTRRIELFEKEIDMMQGVTGPLKTFVLPGGCPSNAALNCCRTVCRRAERNIIRLHDVETVESAIIMYVNRLSDLFFSMARYVSHTSGNKEDVWVKE